MLGSPVRVSPPHCFCTEQKTIPKRTGKLYLSCERGRAGGLHVKCEDGMIGSAPPPCPTTVLRYCLVILPTQLSYRCALRKCAMPMPVHNYSRPRRRAHCSAIPPAFSAIYRLCFGISTNRGAHISFVLTDSQKTRGVSSTHVHSSQCRRTSFFDGHLRLADPLQILPSPQSIPTRHSLAPSFEGRPLSQRRCLVTPLFPLDTKIGGGGPIVTSSHAVKIFTLTPLLAMPLEKGGIEGVTDL